MVSSEGLPENYPKHRVVDVGLRDGSTVRVRPVLPADLYDVADLFGRLSDESSRKRFHGVHRPNEAEIRRFIEVDYKKNFGLVAETSMGDDPRIIALASYISSGENKAEMAMVVDDPFHGRGVGSILLEHLAEAAVDAGIGIFEAEVLSANTEMIEVIDSLELPVDSSASMGVVHSEFPTAQTDEAIEAFERREAIAAAAAVSSFLKPRSVAVVGASRRRGTISGELFHNLLEAGFEGPVFPVNPNAEVVQSVSAYRSVTDIPGPVDLAVIVVPAPVVLAAAQECATAGVRALLVITSGFAEVGPEGRELQQELLAIARRHGMRIIGPNCMGIVNTHPDFRLNATFAPVLPSEGRLAFSSQSGALGIAVMDRARDLGLGLSSFASVGNKADLSGNDLMQYWEQDDATDVILLYLESFGNPRKFARIARRVARRKPIIAVKSGRSAAGARAAASHTGSIVAQDIAVDALFRQAGVIRTDTLEEMFEVASLTANQPFPAGRGVAVLTNAGGLGILCADACEARGLEVRELSPKTSQTLREMLPNEASVGNPVDMIASATPEQYGEALRLLAADPNVDSVITIFIPPLVTKAEDVAATLMEVAPEMGDVTLLACFMDTQDIHKKLRSSKIGIPTYEFPESSARALAKVVDYAEWRSRPEGHIPSFSEIDRSTTVQLIAKLSESGERWLSPDEVTEVLDRYGIPSARSVTVRAVEDVERAATDLEAPLVVKVVSQTIVHKTDVGGVRLNIATPKDAADAAAEILDSLKGAGLAEQVDGFLVQEMVSAEGAEMFVGTTLDPSFGPLVACGAGGTMVELIRDVAVRITPLTDLDAREMLRSLKTWPLFEGYRGQPPLDSEGLESLLLRVSAMVEDLPPIAELDLNPVVVSASGCIVLDARIKVSMPRPAAPRGARTVLA